MVIVVLAGLVRIEIQHDDVVHADEHLGDLGHRVSTKSAVLHRRRKRLIDFSGLDVNIHEVFNATAREKEERLVKELLSCPSSG